VEHPRAERYLATAMPGPRSLELTRAQSDAVSRGVGTTRPVYGRRAFGGIVEGVDGKPAHFDLGSGIAVTTIGNSSPTSGPRPWTARFANFNHNCFMITPYEGYVAGRKRSTGSQRGRGETVGAFNSGSEAVEKRDQRSQDVHPASRT